MVDIIYDATTGLVDEKPVKAERQRRRMLRSKRPNSGGNDPLTDKFPITDADRAEFAGRIDQAGGGYPEMLRRDKDGFFVAARASSKSYETPGKIPLNKILAVARSA